MNGLTRGHLLEIAATFASKSVVIVGDVMLDEYVHGDAHRISPEAPVPVLELRGREYRAGGAANTALNVAALGAKARLLGLVGADANAGLLRDLLARGAVDSASLIEDPSRPTSCKTRIVARGQQVVRVDHESRHPLSAECARRVQETAGELLAGAHACILSDYDKGLLGSPLLTAIIAEARRLGLPVIADPKKRDFRAYAGASLITPNLKELELATGISAATDQEVVAAADSLLPAIAPAALLITRSAAGMTLVRSGAEPIHIPTAAKVVFDVTGAGDTVVSVMALGLATGLPFPELLELANLAAGLVVSKMGTSPARIEDLIEAVS